MGAQTDRIVKIESLLRRQQQVDFQMLLNELGVSPATIKRDLAYLRDRLGSPIAYDRAEDTYRLDTTSQVGERHQIPGLWFSGRELHALLMAHQLLSGLDPNGALNRHVGPLLDRIHQLVGQNERDKIDVMQRIRVTQAGQRPVEAPCFEAVCSALLGRTRLSFRYFTRSRQATSQREASPQRLIYYRNTWYLDAWCHKNNDLRRFALDAMADVQVANSKAKEVAISTVSKALDGGYGIFAGNQVRWARLRFSAQAAQWVATEQWHPEQKATPLADGQLELKVPYVDLTELRMDVMRHGAEVEVLEPKELRQQVEDQFRKALTRYADR